MSFQSVEEYLCDLDRVIAWARQHGVDIHRGRVAAYRATLEHATRRASDVADESPTHADLFAAISETWGLTYIMGLPDAVLSGHRGKLKLLADGHDFYSDIAPHEPDQGRDALFELVTASLFHRAGAKVALEAPADVDVALGGVRMMIECKRPKVDGRFATNITEAFRQLRKHRASGHSGAALVGIDLTRLVNPGAGIMMGMNEDEAVRKVDAAIQATLKRCSDSLAHEATFEIDRSAMVDGLLMRVVCMIYDDATDRPKVCQLWRLSPFVAMDSDRFRTLEAVVSRLPTFASGVLHYS